MVANGDHALLLASNQRTLQLSTESVRVPKEALNDIENHV
jgi:hypothetical protein